jgi:anti-sigma factor RsiW
METGIHELTAGYALDALDPEERRAYEAHLEGCERCREELGSFWKMTDALAVAASGPAPSDALRGRILAAARAEPQNVVPFEPRRSRLAPALGAVAAVAAVVAIGVGIWATQLSGDLDDTRLALEREQAVAEVLSDPSSRTVALEAGTGRLVVSPDGEGVLVLDELGRAPDGMTYEAWIIEGGTPVPAGIFPGGDGRERVPLEGTVDPGDVVAVTIEERRVSAPEGETVVASQPA